MNDACFYSTMWLTPQAKKTSGSFLLFHKMNKYYLNKRKLKYVTAGSRSIGHQTNIQGFLETRFRFRKAYSRLRIVYAPYFYPVVATLFLGKKVLKQIPIPFIQKIYVLLEQEKIRRACN